MLTSSIATPRMISWEEVQFPESWNIQQAIPPRPMIHHHIDEIIENSDGDVSIRFKRQIRSLSSNINSTRNISLYRVSLPPTSRHSFSAPPSVAPPISEVGSTSGNIPETIILPLACSINRK